MLGLIPYGPQFDPTKDYPIPEGFVRLNATNGAFSHFYSREKKLSGTCLTLNFLHTSSILSVSTFFAILAKE